jgi:hypothetical protein
MVAAIFTILPAAAAGDLVPCAGVSGLAVFTTPSTPEAGAPLRVVAVAGRVMNGALVVRAPHGGAVRAGARAGATPYFWIADVPHAPAGEHRIAFEGETGEAACATVAVGAGAERRRDPWPVLQAWDADAENLYSVWIERLFTDRLEAQPSWQGLSDVLGDPRRNLLYDHLELGEDSGRGLGLQPDCADLAYFLRAYFAWKLGLPFGYSDCTRGTASSPPRCVGWRSNAGPGLVAGDGVATMRRFLQREVADTVHSGSGRTPGESSEGDLYPVRLTTDSIRPGTVFADPYGHTLVIVQRIPQTPARSGLLLAVDAQPDKTVARKRYWRGNFLFANDPALGGAGFKRFRPVVDGDDGLRPLDNAEIARHPAYGDFSLEQYDGGAEAFYDRVDEILSPDPRDARLVFREAIDALGEQVRTRVRAVANGEAYMASKRGVVAMPSGAAIFETTGPWEDFATPSRDLRLLIAIDAVREFPRRVARRPHRFTSAADPPVALGRMLDEEAEQRRVSYVRSDGSEWTLTLADVLARTAALEMAYNPNDCIEIRWGAPVGSEEASTCRRRAPAAQTARMRQYRDWFAERRRPPRGT